MAITVRMILDEKGRAVVTAPPPTSISEVAVILHQNRIGAVVIVDDEGRIAGIFTERDLAACVGKHGARALSAPVSQEMTDNVYRCDEGTTVNELMEVMTKRHFRHVPVEVDGKLAGIISIGDVVKSRIREVEQEAEHIKSYIAG
ncbi:CBS domain-containing protein [Martelella lutilitoris]|uniref:CBS domain-containing protein n=1 Tax=Martelella lutilitoris TaxID=2583532 RepID=A0A7T7HI24_9HYPH|nr:MULTISPECIES: CBS domain-containing protein [Martelella]AMM85278.1 inosine-5-monophosphate dehydrogenase [Martelella sp. AD-3]QQM29576.1 CBS domain-containing protein [Martelella lutilitoris]